MTTIFDRERDAVLKRMQEMEDLAQGNGLSGEELVSFLAKSGEYKMLNRLLEILDSNLEQNDHTEYMNKRRHTKLEPLNEEEAKLFTAPSKQKVDEELLIRNLMKNMEADSRYIDLTQRTRADDGNLIKIEWVEEYNRLYKLWGLLNSKTKEYFDYYKLRAETQLGPVSPDKYIVLMGRKPEDGKEFPDLSKLHSEGSEDKDVHPQPEQESAAPESLSEESKQLHDLWGRLNTKRKEDSDYYKLLAEARLKQISPDKYATLVGREPSKASSTVEEGIGYDQNRGSAIDEEFQAELPNNEATREEPLAFQPTGLATKFNPAGTTDFILVGNDGYQHGTGKQDPFDHGTSGGEVPPQEPEEVNLDDLVEVEKITPWKWIKKHKKAILIGLGVTALTITAVLLFNQILPALAAKVAADSATQGAIAASANATKIAELAAGMINNGNSWSAAMSAAEQLGLHSANVSLANTISNLTGMAANYSSASGAWTIGSQTLAQFAASSAATAQTLAADAAAAALKATTAAAHFTKLTHLGTALSVSGLGSLGAGLLIPKEKSQEYHEIKKMIDAYKKDIPTLNKNSKTTRAQEISNRIIASDSISNKERDILLRKLQNAIKKAKKGPKLERVKAERVNLNDQGKYDKPFEKKTAPPFNGSIIFDEDNNIIFEDAGRTI